MSVDPQILKKFKILTKGGKTIRITFKAWNMVRVIVDLINSKEANIIEKEWHDRFKKENIEHYPLNLEDIKTWSTFDDCVELDFSLFKNQLICEATYGDSREYAQKFHKAIIANATSKGYELD